MIKTKYGKTLDENHFAREVSAPWFAIKMYLLINESDHLSEQPTNQPERSSGRLKCQQEQIVG